MTVVLQEWNGQQRAFDTRGDEIIHRLRWPLTITRSGPYACLSRLPCKHTRQQNSQRWIWILLARVHDITLTTCQQSGVKDSRRLDSFRWLKGLVNNTYSYIQPQRNMLYILHYGPWGSLRSGNILKSQECEFYSPGVESIHRQR